MIFKHVIHVSGNFISSYVFTDRESMENWVINDQPLLIKKYGPLKYTFACLPGLQIGDLCHVRGDGDEVYRIVSLVNFSPNRYGFVLDSGCCEEVQKCYRIT